MIYASLRDAKLGGTIGPNAVWRRSGSSGIREIKAFFVDFGTALPTVVIGLDDLQQYLGTSVNLARPLSLQLASAEPHTEPVLTTPAEMVEELRKAFGLNVTQLSQVLHIERITVYAWLRTDRMEKLNPSNRNRLWRLYQIAKQWRGFSPLAGKYLVEPLPGRHTTLLQMLCEDQLDPGAFAQAYELLARATNPSARVQRHRAEQRLALKKGIENLRKNADKFGMDLD
jgi:DNA-binding transcriptional regulator YiaG